MDTVNFFRVMIALGGVVILAVSTVAYFDARASIAALRRSKVMNGRHIIAESAERSTLLDMALGALLAPQMVAGLFVDGNPWLADVRAAVLAIAVSLILVRIVSQLLVRRKLLQRRREGDV